MISPIESSLSVSTISTNRQEIEEYLIDAAKNYFNVNSIDFYKSGLLGFEIEKMSEMFSDLMLNLTFKSDERFINTAKLRSSVANISHEFSYVDKYAEPASIFTVVAVKIESRDYITNEIFIDSKDLVLGIGGITYSIPGDLLIQRQDNNWSVTLQNNLNFEVKTGLLTSELMFDKNNYEYINFIIETRQLDITTTTEILPVRNQLVPYSFNITIESQLVDMKLYRVDASGEKNYLTKLENFSSIDPDLELEVFVVEQIDDINFKIFLGDGTKFKFIPSGSEIFVDVYETLGTKGKTYLPVFKASSKNNLLNREIKAFSNLNSTNGKDAFTFEEYKRDVLSHLQSPDDKTVITEFDYSNVISRLFSVDATDVTTIIRRNDPIQRITELFIKLIEPNSQKLLSTNTIDINITLEQASDIVNYNLSPYTIIKVPIGETNGVIVAEAPTTEELATENKYYMTSLYRILNSAPLRQEVYMLSVFKNSQLMDIEDYIAPNTYFKIFSKIKTVNKVALDHSVEYYFDVQLSSNDNEKLLQEIDFDTIDCYIKFSNKDTGLGYGYIKLDRETAIEQNKSDTSLVGKFQALDCISNGELEVIDIYDITGTYREIGNPLTLPSDVTIEIVGVSEVTDNILNPSIAEDLKGTIIATAWSTETTHITENTFVLFQYKSIEALSLFTEFTNMFYSDIEKIDDLNYTIKKVALIGYQDIIDTANKEFMDNLPSQYAKFWDTIHDIKEEPSIISLKYFNSYGSTDVYSNLDYTDMKLNIEVSFNTTTTVSSVIDEVKEKLVEFVNEKGNTLSMILTERHIYLSEMTTFVENAIPGLRQIRILNYTDNIYYEKELTYKSMSAAELEVFIPSVMNLRTENITITVK